MFKTFGLLILPVFVGFLLYQLLPVFPDDFEDSSGLRIHAIVSSCLNRITQWMWKMGFQDPFLPQRVIFYVLQTLRGESESEEGVSVLKTTMNGVNVLIFLPSQKEENGAAVIYLHGGGYILGSTSMYRSLTSHLSHQLNCVLISVEYHMGPEYVYPSALNEVMDVVEYFMREGYRDYQVDPKRVALVGDSVGGHLAASVALKMGILSQATNKNHVKSVGLIVPMLQFLSFNTPSYLEHVDDPFISRQMAPFSMLALKNVPEPQKYYDMLVANGQADFATREDYARRFRLLQLINRGPKHLESGGIPEAIETFKQFYEDSLLSPLFGNFSHFPPTVILSAKFDVLRDDSLMMIQRLRSSNRTVEHVGIRSSHNGFIFYKSYAPAKRALEKWIASFRYYL